MSDEAGAVKQAVETTVEVAEEAVRNPWVKRLARLGFYSKGFLFVVVGLLAIAVVLGARADLPDQRGALATIAAQGYGRLILIAFIIGAAGHGVWNLLRAAADVDGAGSKWWGIVLRSIQALVGFFYLGLALSAAEIVLFVDGTTDPSKAEETFTSIALSVPILGMVFITLIGIGVVVAGFVECYNGFCRHFRDNYRVYQIPLTQRIVIDALGVLSFTVRAVLLVLIGYLFLRTALFDADGTAIGLDAALLALRDTTFGGILLLIAATGLLAHGVLAFYEAKYRRIC